MKNSLLSPGSNECSFGHNTSGNIINAILLLVFVFCLAGCRKTELSNTSETVSGSSKTVASVQAIPGAFKVMSFNIHHNDPADPQTITERQPLIRQIIVDNTPISLVCRSSPTPLLKPGSFLK